MTEQNYPINPPPELVEKWNNLPLSTQEIIAIAWRNGADTELEACGEWIKSQGYHPEVYRDLRAARRPNPERSAKVALNLLDDVSGSLDAAHENGIRRALERLRELEDSNPKLPTPVVNEPPISFVFEGKRYTRADLVSFADMDWGKHLVIGGVEYFPSSAD